MLPHRQSFLLPLLSKFIHQYSRADAEPPTALQVEQHNLTSMMISWSPPTAGPEVTGYMILYASDRTDSTLTVSESTTSVLVHGIQSGETYRVSAIALSYFPSIETDAIEIFICKHMHV